MEQPEQENKKLGSTSVTVAQFLRERMLCPSMGDSLPQFNMSNSLERKEGMSLERRSVISQQAVNERGVGRSALESMGMSVLERRREELERGPVGDHDLPYSYSLPLSLLQVIAWMTLLARVQHSELHP